MANLARQAWGWFKQYIPDVFVKGRFNFITIHYLYMLGWTILGSVILYSQGGLRYIDCLFFGSGAATQSGLNTVDVDLMHTGQQFTLYIMAMFCNPIVVHSFVVFIRLYWFEKRFKDIVKDARLLRRTKSKSRNNTIQREDPEQGKVHKSIRGKAIQVLRDTGHITDQEARDEKAEMEAMADSASSSDRVRRESAESLDESGQQNSEKRNPLQREESGDVRLPQQLSPDQHIAFLERQRNPREGSTLYIPSPREFDRGGKVEDIGENEDGHHINHASPTSPTERKRLINFNLTSRTDTVTTNNDNQHITIDEPNAFRSREKTSTVPRLTTRQSTNRSLEGANEISSPNAPKRRNSWSLRRSNTQEARDALGVTPYLDFQPTIGRNSFFVDLTEEEREKLGGIEYRALKTLALTLMCYFFAWHAIGVVCLVPWIYRTSYGEVVTNQGQGRAWWGFFTAGSAFNDLGFTLTNDSMIEFGHAVFPLLLMTFLIVIGNTGFPCMLRFTIWCASKVVPVGSGVWEEFMFLLDHPRRCFTLLFPSSATWWLFAILIILNGIDLIFFIILDLNDPTITSIPSGLRWVNGLFQASSTRTAGFAVVNLADLHPAIQVSYLIMMYISAFPIAISMRRTNVYEEKSLGIYGTKADQEADDKEPSYIGAHVRKQLSFDLWYIFMGLFIIAIVEGGRLEDVNQYYFSLFNCLFEIVSAYGTVGLSLGYPTINASFSAEFAVLSKLVIIAMQIRGRHRGLPYELDRAILLPSESLHEKERKEGERIMNNRRRSSIAMSDTSAVEGVNPGGGAFRRETGIQGANGLTRRQTARESSRDRSQPRRGTGQTDGSAESAGQSIAHAVSAMSENHQSRIRSGLGNAMFRLATHPEMSEKGE